LDCSTNDQNCHRLGDRADERSQTEKEEGDEEDPFGFGNGEELTDEEDETTLGDCMSAAVPYAKG